MWGQYAFTVSDNLSFVLESLLYEQSQQTTGTYEKKKSKKFLVFQLSRKKQVTEAIHIINVAIRYTEEVEDTVLSEKFTAICVQKRPQLIERGIRRITFVVLFRRQHPKFFTFRSRDNFNEDRIYRHLEPALAFQLEINRLRTYELEALPTSNQKMHLYLGKAKVAKGQEVTDYRFFIRSIIRHSDLITKEASFEYLQNEGKFENGFLPIGWTSSFSSVF